MIVRSDQWTGSKDSLKWRANETRRLALLGTSRATLAMFTSSARILQEQGRTSVIWPESQLCVGFGVTSK